MKSFVVFAAIAIAFVVAGDREQHKERREMMREKFANMPEEQRQAIRQDVQQRMKEKFDKLTPEQQEKVKNRVSRLMPDGSRAYAETEGDADKKFKAFFDNVSTADKQRVKEHFKSLTPEQRQQIVERAKNGFKHHGRSAPTQDRVPSRNDRRPARN